MNSVLSLDTLKDVIAQLKPLPFCAFTVRPDVRDALRAEIPPITNNESPLVTGDSTVFGVPVYTMPLQQAPAWKFGDKKLLGDYLRCMITEDDLRRLTAGQSITGCNTLPEAFDKWQEFVRDPSNKEGPNE